MGRERQCSGTWSDLRDVRWVTRKGRTDHMYSGTGFDGSRPALLYIRGRAHLMLHSETFGGRVKGALEGGSELSPRRHREIRGDLNDGGSAHRLVTGKLRPVCALPERKGFCSVGTEK